MMKPLVSAAAAALISLAADTLAGATPLVEHYNDTDHGFHRDGLLNYDVNSPPSSMAFTYYGEGACEDGWGRLYPRIRTQQNIPANSPDSYCLDYCWQNPHPQLVGISIFRQLEPYRREYCYCDFSGPLEIFSEIMTTLEYTPSHSSNAGYGVGAIQSTDGDSDYTCYRHNFYGVTSSPTSNPTTLAPTSRKPTPFPSSKPTTLAPTSSNPVSSSPSSGSNNSCLPRATAVKLQSTTGNQIHVFEFMVVASNRNVAPEGIPSQSSTLKNKDKFKASSAVDINLATFSHTNDNSAWLRVDFDEVQSISSVLMHNRWCGDQNDTLGCLCRLTNAKLMLLNGHGSVIAEETLGNTCDQKYIIINFDQQYSCTDETPSPTPSVVGALPKARYLKLHSITGQPIQIFELEAYTAEGTNEARGKRASQTSTFKNKFASLAIDGDRNTFTHTSDRTPVFEVDLGNAYSLESVKIVNRYCKTPEDTPGCLCRLSHAVLALFDYEGNWLDTISLGDTCGMVDIELSML